MAARGIDNPEEAALQMIDEARDYHNSWLDGEIDGGLDEYLREKKIEKKKRYNKYNLPEEKSDGAGDG